MKMLERIEIKYLAKHKPVNPASTMEMWKLWEQARIVAEEEVLAAIAIITTDSEGLLYGGGCVGRITNLQINLKTGMERRKRGFYLC